LTLNVVRAEDPPGSLDAYALKGRLMRSIEGELWWRGKIGLKVVVTRSADLF
jgi:hypothetical protein